MEQGYGFREWGRLSTRIRLFVSILVSSYSLCGFAEAQLFETYIELEGQTSRLKDGVQTNVMVPLAQDSEGLVFTDLRGLFADEGLTAGNWGLAYRRIIGDSYTFGVYGFYDAFRSEYGNRFQQGSLGIELLGTNKGFRLNGYFPGAGLKDTRSLSRASVQGNDIIVRQGLEGAYRGFDTEIESRLWTNREGSDGRVGVYSELWIAAGVYYFDQSDRRFNEIAGPRIRTELRLFDLPFFGEGSRVVVAGMYENDDVREDVITGSLNIRIPIGRRRPEQTLRGLNRRMVAPIVRQNCVITDAGTIGRPEQGKLRSTGQALSGVTVIDANTANPETVFAGAGAGSLVLFNGDAGIIDVAGPFVFNDDQTAVGGGATATIVGCDSGTITTFGSAPTVREASNLNTIFSMPGSRGLLQGITTLGGATAVNIGPAGVNNSVTDMRFIEPGSAGLSVQGSQNTAERIFAQTTQYGQAVQLFAGADGNTFRDLDVTSLETVFANFVRVDSNFNVFENLRIRPSQPGFGTMVSIGSGQSNQFSNVTLLGTGNEIGIRIGSNTLGGRLNQFDNVIIDNVNNGIRVGSSGAGSGVANEFSNVDIRGAVFGIQLGGSGTGTGSMNTLSNVRIREASFVGLALGSSGPSSGSGNQLSDFDISQLQFDGLRIGSSGVNSGQNNTYSNFRISDSERNGVVVGSSGFGSGSGNFLRQFQITNIAQDGLAIGGSSGGDNLTVDDSGFSAISGNIINANHALNFTGTGNTATSPFGNLFLDGGGNSGSFSILVDGVPTVLP